MNLLQFDSLPAWVDGVVTFWRARLQSNPKLRLCLPAGNTPRPVYDAIVSLVAQGWVSFRHTEIFALDEYGGLPLHDEGRCAQALRRTLVDRVDLPPERFHYLDPDAGEADQLCGDYEAAMGEGFDLTLLGLGINGHLGLNEPGAVPDSPTRRVQMLPESIRASAQYVAQKPLPTWGLTVGLQRLLDSREVWLLATGPAKAAILRRTVCGEIGTEVPASLLRRHPHCSAFFDAEAGSMFYR